MVENFWGTRRGLRSKCKALKSADEMRNVSYILEVSHDRENLPTEWKSPHLNNCHQHRPHFADMMDLSSERTEGSAGLVEKPSRRTRSGKRVWSEMVKGRAVFESLQPGARVYARRAQRGANGACGRQFWRCRAG